MSLSLLGGQRRVLVEIAQEGAHGSRVSYEAVLPYQTVVQSSVLLRHKVVQGFVEWAEERAGDNSPWTPRDHTQYLKREGRRERVEGGGEGRKGGSSYNLPIYISI